MAGQEAMMLVTEIDHVTKVFPSEQRYGPSNQPRQAAVSVLSNVAEGTGAVFRQGVLPLPKRGAGLFGRKRDQIEIANNLGI
jgi:hypothetical protein